MPNTIRCSRLPLAMACTGSLVPLPYPVDSRGRGAYLGRAVHQFMSGWIPGTWTWETAPWANLVTRHCRELSDEEAFLEDLKAYCGKTIRLWREVSQWFGLTPRCEVSISMLRHGLLLTGTTDVIAYDADSKTVYVGDFKTGFAESDPFDQLKGYGVLGLDMHREAEEVVVVAVQTQQFVTHRKRFGRAELDEWLADTADLILGEAAYHTGPHCTHCPRWHCCEPYHDYATGAIALLMPTAVQNGELHLYDAMKTVEKLVKRARETIDAEIDHNNGRLEIGGERELFYESQVRQKINYRKGLEVLNTLLTDEQIDNCLRVDKEVFQDGVKANAPRGQKTAAAAAAMELLAQADALDETTVEILRCRKIESPIITQIESEVKP